MATLVLSAVGGVVGASMLEKKILHWQNKKAASAKEEKQLAAKEKELQSGQTPPKQSEIEGLIGMPKKPMCRVFKLRTRPSCSISSSVASE